MDEEERINIQQLVVDTLGIDFLLTGGIGGSILLWYTIDRRP
jgi:hypothetical protein